MKMASVSFKNTIEKALHDIQVPLSDADITSDFKKNFLKKKGVRIVTYEELADYDSINDLLYPYDRCVILYETKRNSGHWTCLFKRKRLGEPSIISFFDSYGLKIDEELEYVPKNLRGDYPHLTYLLYRHAQKYPDLPVEYNEFPLQEDLKGVNTCGKWCVIRMYLNNLDAREFAKLFKSDYLKLKSKHKDYKLKLFPDLTISLMYNYATSLQ